MKITINNCKWEISECSNNNIPLCDGVFFGRTYFFEKQIFINKDLPDDQKIKTLRHELTHAFLGETQITTQEKNDEYTQEMLCEFVGHYGGEIQKIVDKYFIGGHLK